MDELTACSTGSDRQYNPDVILPLVRPSRLFDGLPSDVAEAWDEARAAYSVGSYTAAEVMCRKILMYLAVDKADARSGQSFASYIDALKAAHYISASLKPIVDQIRQRGNIANHELPASTRQEALPAIAITGHLLAIAGAGGFRVQAASAR